MLALPAPRLARAAPLVLTILIPILLSVALFIALWMICLVTGPPNFR